MVSYREVDIKKISEILGVGFVGDNCLVNSLNLANRKLYGNNITYIASESYLEYLDSSNIVAALITKEYFDLLSIDIKKAKSFIIMDEPEKEFYRLHDFLYKNTNFYISDKPSKYGSNVFIHSTAVIEDGVEIGDNVVISANAVVHSGSIIGNDVIIESGAIIGTQGFQVIYENEIPYLVKHVGGVHICDDVFIGANSCVSNSLFDGYTKIGKSTKIDSLVFVAHNCEIGENCVLTSGVVMAGSSSLDDGVWLAPNSVVLNQINVGKNALVCSHSLVMKNVPNNTKVIGVPARRVGNTISRS